MTAFRIAQDTDTSSPYRKPIGLRRADLSQSACRHYFSQHCQASQDGVRTADAERCPLNRRHPWDLM